VVAATMLAEASQPLAERNYHALRAHGGIAPMTKRSRKRAHVVMRHGCDGRLRNAFYHWARVSTQVDPTAGPSTRLSVNVATLTAAPSAASPTDCIASSWRCSRTEPSMTRLGPAGYLPAGPPW